MESLIRPATKTTFEKHLMLTLIQTILKVKLETAENLPRGSRTKIEQFIIKHELIKTTILKPDPSRTFQGWRSFEREEKLHTNAWDHSLDSDNCSDLLAGQIWKISEFTWKVDKQQVQVWYLSMEIHSPELNSSIKRFENY